MNQTPINNILLTARNIIYILCLSVYIYASPAVSAEVTPGSGNINPAALYHDFCSVCHGDKGDGDSHARQGLKPPPRDFTEPGMAALLTRDYIIEITANGKPGTAMTGWSSRLNNKEVAAIADFIRSKFLRISKGTETPVANKKGYEIYRTTCSVCHGDDGTGARWAGSSLKPAPRNFTTLDSRTSQTSERMRNAILAGRPGTTMTSFASQLSSEEVDAVIDYIQTSFMGMPAKQ
jgi:mono/diheme cytochrome c family protein